MVTYIQECHFRVILPEYQQHEVARAVQQVQCRGELAVCKAVQSKVHLQHKE